MVISVGTYEAKTRLTRLIERVEDGESFVITRHGKPVARLVPVEGVAPRKSNAEIEEAFRQLLAMQTPSAEKGEPAWKLKHEGHRY